MAIKRILWAIGTLLLSAIVVVAQSAACPELIYDALNTVNEVCSYTERNQVCYGNFNIEVSGHDGAALEFSVSPVTACREGSRLSSRAAIFD